MLLNVPGGPVVKTPCFCGWGSQVRLPGTAKIQKKKPKKKPCAKDSLLSDLVKFLFLDLFIINIIMHVYFIFPLILLIYFSLFLQYS